MRGIHHRAPGPVVAAMHADHVTLEIINDGVHVHPDVVRLAFAGAPGRVALVTDAMAAAGSADGAYLLGSLEVIVEGGIARLLEGGSIAGSTLTQDVGPAPRVVDCGIPLDEAVGALTVAPAAAIGRSRTTSVDSIRATRPMPCCSTMRSPSAASGSRESSMERRTLID